MCWFLLASHCYCFSQLCESASVILPVTLLVGMKDGHIKRLLLQKKLNDYTNLNQFLTRGVTFALVVPKTSIPYWEGILAWFLSFYSGWALCSNTD